ncbi:winged helix-turn-helix domain-containing protein [Achromobacter sp. UMC71]|uniref:winged helix-turn-helix domain-containing protein n=1 Tax=Achromobacter sp. UMC71 TaxID=1862320 RepID=UPI0015FF62AE|nr:winged helix-turn-helix domain-containing protein [Achromobacter sp. UMC71]MBB1627960.1 transcriptional regulator [Achromobacter sp. UMC71]
MGHVMLTGTPESGDRLQFADLELDLLRYRAYRDGQMLMLTPKEFGLLALLMGSPGAVFTSWQLAEQVWKTQAKTQGPQHVKCQAVAIAMRRLRKKVDGGSRPRLLHVIRGGSFMLAAGPL